MFTNSGNSIMLGKTAASTDRQKDFMYKFLTHVSACPYLQLLTSYPISCIYYIFYFQLPLK
jgi:hypothetical protein